MKLLSFVVMGVALTGCASSPKYEWRAKDTRREIFFAAALAADTYTTANFQDDPRRREGLGIARSIYGDNPDPESVIATAIVGGIAHWLIARRVGHKFRPYWQYGFTSVHGAAAAYNCSKGETC
jgi:hypothetical protein